MRLKHFFMILVVTTGCFAQAGADLENKSKIAFTPHNLVGTRAVVGEDSLLQDFTLCRVCHIPSKMTAVEPLWYRKEFVRVFDVDKHVELEKHHLFPADNISRSCLFCHDGSVSRGFPHKEELKDRQVSLLEAGSESVPNLHLHLFAFENGDTETRAPSEDSELRLEENSRISCATCHDPHNNEQGSFLRMSNEGSSLCVECHQMANWELSAHGNPADPRFRDVKNLGCAHCHDIHGVPASTNLLAAEETTVCLSCHDGSKDDMDEVASNADLENVFEKPFIHPISWNSSREMPESMDAWSRGLGAERGVTCSDCHNPHAASDQNNGPFLDGSQVFVSGVDNEGFTKAIVDYEYETCYKCHGMNQSAMFGRNVGQLFAKTNMSFHPIEAPGNNPYVQSLKIEWSEQSLIKCTDCHGNDDPLGAQGPHGSDLPHILKQAYAEQPFAQPEESELCFQCHVQGRVVQGSGFKYHKLHIEEAGYACSACHNPHGSVEYPGLMDLNAPFIQPVNGILEVSQTEPGHGTCTLMCHGKVHPGQYY
ncbi:MAG: cytochrome c3 family protein [Candidatus Marinimicrobia bacterium]|nr:cytochrome c3 family protein [Candidatus Neomarinimicrobiota bacterium]MCF7850851.1 cytochrome c3 family protein [Candidatus Neomarinimicrobiota bacterium]MCF7905106.1 cytochrome c3 family protein [Candidatus Neomarinimicrobiota bacterium]